ncbi:hypothetical protein JCM11251_004407 [Rhodosporidiobolus azoricus]
MTVEEYDNIIVGGGPAGLVALKTLSENGFKCCLFEAEESIGGTFKYRSYESSELVSSKQLTSFSDFRFPPEQGDHVSLDEFVAYLERYCTHFNLWNRIKTGSRVVKINRGAGGKGHVVEVRTKNGENTKQYRSRYLTMCTGLHVIPSIPDIPGLESLRSMPGKQVLHSSEYKTRSQLKGKKVLIMGTGETGMDLAYASVKAGAKEVVLCSRSGFLSFPKVLNNFTIFGSTFDGHLPIDGLITNLCESCYVHPWVAASHLRWFVSDFVIKRVLWFLTGTMAGCNQWVGELPPEKLGRAYVFLNKSHAATHFINRPYRNRSRLASFFTEYHDPPEDVATPGVVEMAPFPINFDEKGGVIWDWETCEKRGGSWKKVRQRMEKRRVEPDLVLLATGYTQEFSSFLAPTYPRPWDATIRDIISPSSPDVAFLGFVRPGVGAIPPIAEQQAMWITALWKGYMKEAPRDEAHYYLLAKPEARIKYGVDHSTYMSTLARDMGASPGLFELLRTHGAFITFVYCFSASFTSHYRLLGPFRSPSAPEVVRTEIWDTVKRRGLLGNLFMGLIPMVFYAAVNLLALVLEAVWLLAGKPDVLGFIRKYNGGKLPFLVGIEGERKLKEAKMKQAMEGKGMPN